MGRYTFVLEYKKRTDNLVSDALSRYPVANAPSQASEILAVESTLYGKRRLFLKELLQAQLEDGLCQGLRAYLQNPVGWPNDFIRRQGELSHINQEGFVMTKIGKGGRSRNVHVAPVKVRLHILTMAHCHLFSGHAGTEKTLLHVLENFWWPGITEAVRRFVRGCERCQMNKNPPRYLKEGSPTLPAFLPSAPNVCVHVDLYGPLHTSPKGNKYILSMVDTFTKFCVAVVIPSKEASVVVEAIFERYICVHSVQKG